MIEQFSNWWSVKTPEEKKKVKWEVTLGAVTLGVLALLAPILISALEATLALGALFVLGVSGMAFIPWFSMKMANLGVKAVVHEAQQNPIETLYNIAREREGEINATSDDLVAFDAELRTFKKATTQHKQRFPEADVSDKVHIIEEGARFVEEGKAEIESARNDLKAFQNNIEMTASELELAKQMGRITDRMLQGGGKDVLTKLKAHTALQSAERKMNESLAKLSMVMARKPNFAGPSLAYDNAPPIVIDGQQVRGQRVHVAKGE
jgi:hypothetical protein